MMLLHVLTTDIALINFHVGTLKYISYMVYK
jgi:hypothetical protein